MSLATLEARTGARTVSARGLAYHSPVTRSSCAGSEGEWIAQVADGDADAFARIYAARESDLEEGARFVGAFRANGLAIPVWELVPGTEAEELTKPLQATGKRLEAALADSSPLSPEVRRAKAGIISRQVNL